MAVEATVIEAIYELILTGKPRARPAVPGVDDAARCTECGNVHEEKECIFTCAQCGAKGECEFAFEAYNTNGDCLAEK